MAENIKKTNENVIDLTRFKQNKVKILFFDNEEKEILLTDSYIERFQGLHEAVESISDLCTEIEKTKSLSDEFFDKKEELKQEVEPLFNSVLWDNAYTEFYEHFDDITIVIVSMIDAYEGVAKAIEKFQKEEYGTIQKDSKQASKRKVNV